MSLAWISVGALLLAVVLSCTTTINVGILSLALALIVGLVGHMRPAEVLAGFPADLLVTLVGVTLLFAIAEVNGTLARLTDRAVRLCRGHAGVLPVMFFVLGFTIATIGAGATPASALLAPPAMAIAARAQVPPLLMAIMTGNGALAGTLSPFAPTGIVAHGVMRRIGLGGVEWQTFGYNALAHALVGIVGFLLLGGWKLFRTGAGSAPAGGAAPAHGATATRGAAAEPFERQHWATAAAIAALIVAVAGFELDVGMVTLTCAAILILLRAADESRAIQRMPWGVILMVTGVSVLVALLGKTEGLTLISDGIAAVSTPTTIEPVAAFGTGLVSVYSSTSGVVLPAFLPMAPALAERLGGIPPLPIAWSMNVSASLVDLSSLSTVGALYIASAAPGTDTRRLFNQLLAWGLAMTLVGAALCYLLFG
ncbi:MAG TPA: SLC13 family permease [Gammaproteobacteria bacterium]|nr:SLC13 family permease [Gammaproteobacteria bacterium]